MARGQRLDLGRRGAGLALSPAKVELQEDRDDTVSAAASPFQTHREPLPIQALDHSEKYCSAGFALFVCSGPISRHSRPGNSPASA
mgnify:CR=1 FL=1